MVIFLVVLLNFKNSFAEDYPDELQMLRAVFRSEVSAMAINDQAYIDNVVGYSREKLVQSPHWQESQYFVFVDRNEKRQNAMVGFFKADDGSISILGWDRVSTGDPSRSRHFLTPTGIFENSIKNPSFRARGTKNAKGWRGFGIKHSRVWDFGWQRTIRKNYPATIRMMMHATDPVWGEKRLGTRDSKGCIRISAKMNNFLDIYGIIDRDYIDHPKSEASGRVLRKDRKTIIFPGRYLVIGDFEL